MALHHMLRAAAGNAGPSDPYFEYNTLLLTGNGTNGAQNNTFLDSSSNNFTITRNGNTTQGTFSPYGNLWSNYFDGSGDWLTLGGQSAFAFGTGDWTVELWAYASTLSSAPVLFDFRPSSTNGAYPLVYINTDGTVDYYTNGGAQISSSSGTFKANSWTHVAVCRSGTATKLFVNGVQVGSTYSDSNNYLVGANRPIIAERGYSAGAAFSGYISNLRIVKGTALYTSNFTPSTTPLTAVSGTSLLTCQSNRFKDNSSNNFTITRNGDVSVRRFSPFNPTAPYSANTIGGSGYFDGTGDSLTLNSSTGVSISGDFTYETWIYPTTVSPTYQQIAHGTSLNGSNVFQILLNGSTLYLWSNLSHQTAVTPNAWHHVALVRQSNTVYLYLDGVQSSSSISTSSTATVNTIGNNGSSGTETFNGYQSNARFVSSALYTSNFTPPTAPLTAVSGTSLLCNFTNAGIPDAAMMNDLETVGNAQVSTSVKKYGTGSLAFDGTGDWLQLPYTPNLQFTGNFTVECWVNPTSKLNYYPCIVGNYSTFTTNGGFAIFAGHNSGSTTKFNVSFNGSFPAITSTSNIAYGSWQHLALVRNGSTITLYVNGVAEGTTTSSATVTGTANYWWIGTAGDDTSGGAYNGYIDDLRITKGYARYTSNFTPPTAALPTY